MGAYHVVWKLGHLLDGEIGMAVCFLGSSVAPYARGQDLPGLGLTLLLGLLGRGLMKVEGKGRL